MIIKTIIFSIILIFLLQLIYNFVYDRFLTKIPPENIKFSAVEKYKKIAEELASAASVAKKSTPIIDITSSPEQTIETIFDVNKDVETIDEMENELLNLVINGQ